MSLFGGQYGVAHVAQLGELGIPRRSVTVAVRRGIVDVALTRVVAIPGQWNTLVARAMALHLAAERRGHVSGQSAGSLYALRQMRTTPVWYTVPYPTTITAPKWAAITRSSWPDEEARPARDDGLVVASPLRMLFDLASQLPEKRFERAAEDAWHRGLVTPDAAAAYLERIRRSGRAGVSGMDRWLERVAEQTRPATTGLEQLLVALADRAGLPPPERQHPLRLRSGVEIHLDLAWPDIRLALEPGHSWWHGGNLAQRADQDRDRACGELGWQILRFDESVWERQPETIQQIKRTYDQRLELLGSRADRPSIP